MTWCVYVGGGGDARCSVKLVPYVFGTLAGLWPGTVAMTYAGSMGQAAFGGTFSIHGTQHQ
jgi:uncharacterized membrane protein YdjX (TVP38/TMEM64 family)